MRRYRRDALGRFATKGKAKRKPRSMGRARTRAKRSPSISRQVESNAKSEARIGAQNLKSGARTVGQTGNLTPTKRGFAILSKDLLSVQRSQKIRGRRRLAYSFALTTRFRGADGRYITSAPRVGGFPSTKAVRQARRKGESEAHAFRRIVELSIIRAVFRPVDGDVRGATYPELQASLKNKSPTQVRKAIARFKKQRDMTFQVTIRKE